jgi:hypothetical protein
MAQTAARADSVALWFWAEAEAAMAAVTVAAATVAAANRDAITITKPPEQPRRRPYTNVKLGSVAC